MKLTNYQTKITQIDLRINKNLNRPIKGKEMEIAIEIDL